MLLLWIGLFALILVLVIFDLTVFHRQPRYLSFYEALAASIFWVSLGLGFAFVVYFMYEQNWLGSNIDGSYTGKQALLEYLTAFTLEKTLSFDNLFVIAIIFQHFQIPVVYQHRVLMFGLFGAVFLRSMFIIAGIYILSSFDWMIYVLAIMLLFGTLKYISNYVQRRATRENTLVRLAQRFMPVEQNFADGKLVRRSQGRLVATPLLITLILIESADLMFAMDSIPAIMAVSREPFILISSNLFALLGLRALYFLLASALEQFHYLRISMILILIFMAIKLLLTHTYPIDTLISLAVIIALLGVGVIASLIDKQRGQVFATSPLAEDLGRVYEITFTSVRRIAVLGLGTSVIIIGVIMIFTPGPAIVVIPAGLAILATEFVWARHLLKKLERKFVQYSKDTMNYLRRDKSRSAADDHKDQP